MKRHATRSLALVICALLLTACGSREERDLQSGADILFERARSSMLSGNFRSAIQYYEVLEARYPFSNQAKQAQLDLIYCYYKNNETEAAIDAAIQFERENPTHPRVDYALYMRGLAQFRGQRNALHRLMRVDLAKRPPVQAREAISAFAQLVQRFPDSAYAADAQQRMRFLRNRLAAHENHVAEYYMERGAWVAALNRARYAMETFEGAPAVADSLKIMVRAYEELGMVDLAAATRRVLAENYPEALQQAEEEAAEEKKRFIFF